MLKTKIEKRQVEVIKDILCNACKKSCTATSGFGFSYATLSAKWGYSSKKDMENHLSHICEDCYDKIVKNFKIPSLIAEDQF